MTPEEIKREFEEIRKIIKDGCDEMNATMDRIEKQLDSMNVKEYRGVPCLYNAGTFWDPVREEYFIKCVHPEGPCHECTNKVKVP